MAVQNKLNATEAVGECQAIFELMLMTFQNLASSCAAVGTFEILDTHLMIKVFKYFSFAIMEIMLMYTLICLEESRI